MSMSAWHHTAHRAHIWTLNCLCSGCGCRVQPVQDGHQQDQRQSSGISEMSLIPTARPGLADPRKAAAQKTRPASCSAPSKAELHSREQPTVSFLQRSSLGGGLLSSGLADEGLSEPRRQSQSTQSDTGATLGKPLRPLRQGQPPGDQAAHCPFKEQPGLNPPAAQPVQPGSGPHQALPSSPFAGAGQQHGFTNPFAKPSRQQPGAQPGRVAAGGTPADAEWRHESAAEAQQIGRPQPPPSANSLSGSMQQQGRAGQAAAEIEAAGMAGQPLTVVKPQVKRRKPTGPLWARASSTPPVASSTLAAASSGPEPRGGVPDAPAATPCDAGASAAQSPAQGSAVSGAALGAGSIPLPMPPGAGQADAEPVAAQGSDSILADMSVAALQPPQKHDTIKAQRHAGGQAPPSVPQHGAPAEQQQQQQPSTSCPADPAAAPSMDFSTEQQQQPSTSCAAAAAAPPVLIGSEQRQQPASTKAAADPAAAPSTDLSIEQQQQPSTSCAAAAAAPPVLIGSEQRQQPASTKAAADPAAAPSTDLSTEQQQQPSTSCAAAAAAPPVLVGTEQRQQPAPSVASHPVVTNAHHGSLPVDAELDMFAEPGQQPTVQRGAALRRQQELAQALVQVVASAPGVVLPAEPQPEQGAPSMKAQHAAAPRSVQQSTLTARAQDAPTPQGMLPALPAGAGTMLCSRQGLKLPNPAAAAAPSSEQVLPLPPADAAARKETQAIASPVASPQSSQQLSPPHAATAGAGKASSSRQSPQQQGAAEPGPPSSPRKRLKPVGWKTVGTWQAGQFVGLKSPLSPSTGPLQPAGTSSAGQAAAAAEAAAGQEGSLQAPPLGLLSPSTGQLQPVGTSSAGQAAAAAAEAPAGQEGSLPAPPLGLQQAGRARHVPAWCVDCPGGSSVPQRQEVMLQIAGQGRLLGVPALAELQLVWSQMHGRLWPSSGAWADPWPQEYLPAHPGARHAYALQ